MIVKGNKGIKTSAPRGTTSHHSKEEQTLYPYNLISVPMQMFYNVIIIM